MENTQALLSAENWGLGFGSEGTQPSGTASSDKLKEYNAYYVGDAGEKKIYLTFDCGYENGNTSQILDALKNMTHRLLFRGGTFSGVGAGDGETHGGGRTYRGKPYLSSL